MLAEGLTADTEVLLGGGVGMGAWEEGWCATLLVVPNGCLDDDAT